LSVGTHDGSEEMAFCHRKLLCLLSQIKRVVVSTQLNQVKNLYLLKQTRMTNDGYRVGIHPHEMVESLHFSIDIVRK